MDHINRTVSDACTDRGSMDAAQRRLNERSTESVVVGLYWCVRPERLSEFFLFILPLIPGTAADIIEFFDSYKDNTIASEALLVFLTLGIWSWSLLQFTIVLSATRSRKPRGGGATSKDHEQE